MVDVFLGEKVWQNSKALPTKNRSAICRQNTSKPHCTPPCAEGKTSSQRPIHVYFWNDISIYVARSLPARQTFLRFFWGFWVFAIGWWGCAWKVNDMLPFKMTYDWRYIPLQGSKHMDKYSITSQLLFHCNWEMLLAFKALNRESELLFPKTRPQKNQLFVNRRSLLRWRSRWICRKLMLVP